MTHRRTWIKCSLAIVLLWATAGAAMAWLSSFEVTPGSIVEGIRDKPIQSVPQTQRAGAVDDLAQRFNRLNVTQRRNPELMQEVRGQFESMTLEEQRAFIRQVMPVGVEPMIRAVLALPPKSRKRLVNRVMGDLGDDRAAAFRAMLGEEGVDQFVVQWLESFLNVDNPQMQFEMLPMIEQMMFRLQSGGRVDRDGRDE
ncbi:MAG: hypothetical protein AAGH88_07945 [Planctomycetota bacterium]